MNESDAYYREKSGRVYTHPNGNGVSVILTNWHWHVLDNFLEKYWGITAGFLIHKRDYDDYSGSYQEYFDIYIRDAWPRMYKVHKQNGKP